MGKQSELEVVLNDRLDLGVRNDGSHITVYDGGYFSLKIEFVGGSLFKLHGNDGYGNSIDEELDGVVKTADFVEDLAQA